MPIKLTVNGKPQTVNAPGEMPLLWALRDVLDLKGTKYGCGMSVCGMCTVHVDGVATRSCVTTLASVAGKKITTIEGLAADGSHPLQKAWIDLDVAQCGYCQAGQIMSAAALLAATPKPTETQIEEAMDGNLCRCGTYMRIRDAIRKAAGAGAPKSAPAGVKS
jgi:isoquinoline 1-oxidoreductase alpha subunit